MNFSCFQRTAHIYGDCTDCFSLYPDPDNMMKQVLGNGYKENDYYSGYLTIYKSDGESDVYTFSSKVLLSLAN